MAATTVAQQFSHTPVLLKEVLHYISPITALTAYRGSGAAGRRRQLLSSHKDTSAYTFVDATFGGGGYTKAILNTFPGSKVIAIDQDPAAIHEAKLLAEKYEPGRLIPVRGKFGNMSSLLEKELGMTGPCVDGVVFDIGVSSFQIDQGYRGFSWRFDGPLDMRMCADKIHGPRFDELANSSYTAEHIVNTFSEFDLANIIYEYGEERKSRKIARAIVKARTSEPITSTTQLGKIVVKGVGKYSENTHPAMRTFQALRIYINDELNQFKYGLSAAETLLKPSGTLVGVTFHSLEDSILKTFLREASGIQAGPGLRYYKESGKNGYRGIEKYRRRHYKAELPTIAAMEMAFEQDVERLEMNLRDDTLEATSGETCDSTTFKIITRRAVPPGSDEIKENPRARSAKLRAAVRTSVKKETN